MRGGSDRLFSRKITPYADQVWEVGLAGSDFGSGFSDMGRIDQVRELDKTSRNPYEPRTRLTQ